MTQYEPAVIQKFADLLYKRARSIIRSYAVFGAMCGIGAGVVLIRFLEFASAAEQVEYDFGPPFLFPFVGACVLGLLAGFVGANKAFSL